MIGSDHYDYWFSKNRLALEHLYYLLIDMADTYGINIIDDDESATNFIKMMYYESNGSTISKTYFPEYYS